MTDIQRLMELADAFSDAASLVVHNTHEYGVVLPEDEAAEQAARAALEAALSEALAPPLTLYRLSGFPCGFLPCHV